MPENPRLRPDLDKPCNHFELRVENCSEHGKRTTDGKLSLHPEIWVDRQHIDEPHFIDLPLLVQSLHVQGWYEIFTCGCGVAGCAGIVEGIHVTHDAGLTRWSFRRPQSAGTLSDSALKKWQQTALPFGMTFDRAQMVKAIQDYLDAVRTLVSAQPSRFDWPVHGLSVSDVLRMDPGKPFYAIKNGK